MNKKIINISLFFILVVFTVYCTSLTVFAGSNSIKDIINKIDDESMKEVDASIKKLYKDDVLPILLKNKQNLGISNISEQSVKDAILSAPMPILSSESKYNAGEDFKSKLQHTGWLFIVYAENKPIAVFQVEKQGGEYIVQNTINEYFAKACSDSINQLNTKNPVIIPASGYYFIGDVNDNILLVKPQGFINEEFDIKTFEEFNRAVNKTIDYYSKQTEMTDGGSILLEYMYRNISNNQSEQIGSNLIIFGIGVLFLLLLTVVFINKKIKFKSY